jgi:hypothetical protein
MRGSGVRISSPAPINFLETLDFIGRLCSPGARFDTSSGGFDNFCAPRSSLGAASSAQTWSPGGPHNSVPSQFSLQSRELEALERELSAIEAYAEARGGKAKPAPKRSRRPRSRKGRIVFSIWAMGFPAMTGCGRSPGVDLGQNSLLYTAALFHISAIAPES